MAEQRREYFRLEYPMSYRPSLKMGGKVFDVVEVSECGIKFLLPKQHSFGVDQKIKANIQFYDEEVFPCEGYIIRIEKDVAVILLSEGLPLHKIRTEHIFLINKSARFYN